MTVFFESTLFSSLNSSVSLAPMLRRIWMDGCFDLFHYGHANALRQAKQLGGQVVCGINFFEDIKSNKGLPVFTDDEREEIVKSCRWVDEVVSKVPYTPSVELINEYNCDIAVHGDDPATDKDGVDVYANPKAMGIFKEVGRTTNISTTEIVGRLMLQEKKVNREVGSPDDNFFNDLIKKFARPEKKKEGEVVFIDGVFDLYHAGHCKALENAKKNGDYLIVGLFSDEMTEKQTNSLPILNEKERLLVLMSNKHVDEIIFSPFTIDEDFLRKHGITKVLNSYDVKDLSRFRSIKNYVIQDFNENPFSSLSTDNIVNRIIRNYQSYVQRQMSKKE